MAAFMNLNRRQYKRQSAFAAVINGLGKFLLTNLLTEHALHIPPVFNRDQSGLRAVFGIQLTANAAHVELDRHNL